MKNSTAVKEYLAEIGRRGGQKSKRALSSQEAKRLSDQATLGRRAALLARYRHELERLESEPPIEASHYSEPRHHKRAVSLRQRRQNELERRIRCLEAGQPVSKWMEF